MALAPKPKQPIPRLAERFIDPRRERLTALDMLGSIQAFRSWLNDYEAQLVVAARKGGATWAEIGEAIGMARQNAERKFRQAVRDTGHD